MAIKERKITPLGEEITKEEQKEKLIQYHISEAKNYSKFGISTANNLILELISDVSKIDKAKFNKRIYETCGRLRCCADDPNSSASILKYEGFTSDDYNELADKIKERAEEFLGE